MGNVNIYGYIRVSTREQNEDRQLIALHELDIPEKTFTSTSSQVRTLSVRSTSGWCAA